MPCSCQKNRQQFEVVREGGTGKTVFRSSVQSTAETVGARYPGSVVRNEKTGEVVAAGKGSLELVASGGDVLLRTDDADLLAKVAAANEGSTARDTTTGQSLDLVKAE
ncbi:hypothetical protein [Streptomyces sp. NPDC088847]|uniref:hypothetical protein n=1 Tax=Streptomyces sp. NPDC088847 TaxID=3365909 RepID=UPI00382B71DD